MVVYRIIFLLLFITSCSGQEKAAKSIPSDLILSNSQILYFLKSGIKDLQKVYRLRDLNKEDLALEELANYFKEKSSMRYYFNWKNFSNRFENYENFYSSERPKHFQLAKIQITSYNPETNWQLPFKNLLGNDVTAYELRHLARQQKSVDMALVYYYLNEDQKYLDYFTRQVADLNRAFLAGEYDDAGNGIYERFRAGKRIHNWLFCHHAYLASFNYKWKDQILFIKTMLHHGAQLAKRTKKFSYGNHHTKGLVALFQISAIFPEFVGTENWQKQSLHGLEQHLKKEVNEDGFQFERSVHYHNGDIDNYFRVYQLGKLNQINIPDIFEIQFKKMFDSLVQMAQPNRRLPVLQDDTDFPFTENNPIDNIMLIGSLIFENSEYRYFTDEEIPSNVFWFFRPEQIEKFFKIKKVKPEIGSIFLEQTGYYVMRNGWQVNSKHSIITAGLSDKKPDHQHGDMLGLVAYANGHEILPNFQVAYKYPDYSYWKNSWVKNVALVDSISLARGWKPNTGGSGFGKWKILPNPKTLVWESNDLFDYYSGTHNSYDSIGVSYQRDVLFIKDGFWILKDKFESESPHTYQQVWQGHFDEIEENKVVRSVFEDYSGLDIIQLRSQVSQINYGGKRGKGNVVFVQKVFSDYEFTTLIYPFASKEEMISYKQKNEWKFGNWLYSKNLKFISSDAAISITKNENVFLLFNVSKIERNKKSLKFGNKISLFIFKEKDLWKFINLSQNPVEIENQDSKKIIIDPFDPQKINW